MRFMLFLEDRGLLDPPSLVALLRAHLGRQTPLGQLALRHRLLTVKQLAHLLDRQVEVMPSPPLGRLAVEAGFISNEQLETLLGLQRSTHPPGDDLIAAHLGLSADELVRLRHEFHLSLIEGAPR